MVSTRDPGKKLGINEYSISFILTHLIGISVVLLSHNRTIPWER